MICSKNNNRNTVFQIDLPIYIFCLERIFKVTHQML